METNVIRALEIQRPAIRAHWESLLRLERVNSPLAQPDLLVRLLDRTLDDLFATLSGWSMRRHPPHVPAPTCACGRNPLLAYYAAGHQALREALVIFQADILILTGTERDEELACLDQVFRHVTRREIEAFCALCQFRAAAAHAGAADVPPAFNPSSRATACRGKQTMTVEPRGETPG